MSDYPSIRCYVCGKTITGNIALVSMSNNVDRVFTSDLECVKFLSDVLIIEVRRVVTT